MRTSVLYVLSLAFLLAQEPSAFNAGDLSSNSPYGLSSTEKHILNNKRKLNRLTLKVSKLEEKMQTISDLFVSTTDKMQKDIFSIDQKIQSIEARVSNELLSAQENTDNKINANIQSLETLKQILTDLTKLTKSINSNYVHTDTMKLYERKKSSKKIFKKNKAKKVSFSKLSGHTLTKKGEKLFSKKKYNEATDVFKELIKRNYRASRSNYYLGEIHFYKKKYKQALIFYKKSVKIYSKSSFMPNLLLHAGVSSFSIKDNGNAKKFFLSVVSSFPKTKEAKEAKKFLKKIKK